MFLIPHLVKSVADHVCPRMVLVFAGVSATELAWWEAGVVLTV